MLPGRLARNSVAPFDNTAQSPYQAQQLAADSRLAGRIERLHSGIRLAPLPPPLKTQRNRRSESQQAQLVGGHAWPDMPSANDGIGRLGSLEASSALLPSGLDTAQIKQDAAGSAQSQPTAEQPVKQPGSGANQISGNDVEHVTEVKDSDSSVASEDRRDTMGVEQSRPGCKWWQSVLLVRHLHLRRLPVHGKCMRHHAAGLIHTLEVRKRMQQLLGIRNCLT